MKQQDPRRATEIKKLLKANGIDPRLIRSKLNKYSMGSSLTVTILSRSINREDVVKILKQFEKYDRCEITGDILSGCNRYVFVTYSEPEYDPIDDFNYVGSRHHY